MSRDDEIDYRVMFPIEGRNRKRFAANPRKPKEPQKTYGFFSRSPTEESRKKAPEVRRNLGKRYDDDGRAMPSMAKQIRILVAKDLDRSAKSIAAELDKLGYEAAPSTVSSIRQEIIAILRLCEAHGSIIVPAWRD
ncbi:hypothetical protein JQ580_29870 [Bradyrhizobium japonicum]|uniref:hypothetical protein n=1 Tax=Bradyrhizobium japonicum TaxID=375 RepID=UPI001BAB23CA|nr:hypothetical protein [Bradyrhizobium japonicum]MBR0994924.1 hypothetical protein [Bradyrhizobium japonicum]